MKKWGKGRESDKRWRKQGKTLENIENEKNRKK